MKNFNFNRAWESHVSSEISLIQKCTFNIFVLTIHINTFSNETLNFLFRKFCFSCILDLTKTVWALRILLQIFTRSFVIKEFWALENHVLVNMLLWSSHFIEVHWVYIGTWLKTFSLPFPCPSYLDILLGLPSLADF